MKKIEIGSVLLRLALAAGFLSAVASRFGLWSSKSGWREFLSEVAQVNSWAPSSLVPTLAVASTTLEIGFSLLLLIGYKTKFAALGAAILTLIFALSMTCSFGIKAPLDYSVFVDSAAAFVLYAIGYYPIALDAYLSKRATKK